MKLSPEIASKIAERLNYRHQGLVVAVVQDSTSGDILMVAFMDREAVVKTLTTGYAHYWSRSRGRLWMKGESSGNLQEVEGVRVDCDLDALLVTVRQHGNACHKGKRSCFYRDILDLY